MGPRAPLTARAAALAYVAIGAYAGRVAVADEEPPRFAGLSYPGTDAYQFLWLGTALSAPAYILAGYARAGLRGDRRALHWLAAVTVVGQLGEPIT